MIDTAARCGFSRCRAELPAPGPQGGRRRSFCRDTRWEGGRTCAQMARGERDALDALGLDGGGTAFRLDADRLREHVDAVRAPVGALAGALDAVSARLDEVQHDAVAAVEVAHRRAAESDAERVAAEAAQQQAEAETARHRETVERAGAERDEAVRRAAAAARQALEATEALGAARQAAEEAAGARVAAEERAAAAGDRAAHAERASAEALRREERTGAERDAALARATELRDELAALRAENDRLRAEAGAAAAATTAAQEQARERVAAAERPAADRVAATERPVPTPTVGRPRPPIRRRGRPMPGGPRRAGCGPSSSGWTPRQHCAPAPTPSGNGCGPSWTGCEASWLPRACVHSPPASCALCSPTRSRRPRGRPDPLPCRAAAGCEESSRTGSPRRTVSGPASASVRENTYFSMCCRISASSTSRSVTSTSAGWRPSATSRHHGTMVS